MVQIRQELQNDLLAIENLLDLAFGQDRHSKVSYRFRSGLPHIAELARVAVDHAGELIGTIRFWPIDLSTAGSGLLLGPLAIHPNFHGRGIGRGLVFSTLNDAELQGHKLVFLVGDESYYRRFGFATAPAHIVMPGEQPSRLQMRTLNGKNPPASPCTILRARCLRGEVADLAPLNQQAHQRASEAAA